MVQQSVISNLRASWLPNTEEKADGTATLFHAYNTQIYTAAATVCNIQEAVFARQLAPDSRHRSP